MSTRGFVGYIDEGMEQPVGCFIQKDAYPAFCGEKCLNALLNNSQEEIRKFWKEKVELVREIDTNDECSLYTYIDRPFTEIDKARLIDGKDFYRNAVSCEYTYIFDLRTGHLVLYEGCQTRRDGRVPEDWTEHSGINPYYVTLRGEVSAFRDVIKLFRMYFLEYYQRVNACARDRGFDEPYPDVPRSFRETATDNHPTVTQ